MDETIHTYAEAADAILAMTTSDAYLKLLLKRELPPYHQIIGREDEENTHSNFLGWLLRTSAFYSAPQTPLGLLMKLLATKAVDMAERYKTDVETYFPDRKLLSDVLLDRVKFDMEEVQRESVTVSAYGKGRADIVVKGRYFMSDKTNHITLVCENKIKSSESKDQCQKYYDAFRSQKGTKIFFFLAPISPANEKDNGLSCPNFLVITYQELYDYVLRPLLMLRDTYSPKIANRLKTYIDTISLIRNYTTYMVMDKETKQLLADLFKENQDLILAAVQTSEDAELVAKVENAASSNKSKDFYVVADANGSSMELTRPKTFKNVVERLCAMGKSYEEIAELLRQWQLGGNNIGLSPYANNDRDSVCIDGKMYYLNMNKWNLVDVQNLVKGVNGAGLGMTISQVMP